MTRQLTVSQRAMQAARSEPDAATTSEIEGLAARHSVGQTSVWRARALIASGDEAMIRKVDRGTLTVNGAYETLMERRRAAGLKRGAPPPQPPRLHRPRLVVAPSPLPPGLEQVGRWVENGAALAASLPPGADAVAIIEQYNRIGRPLLEVHLQRVHKFVMGLLVAARKHPPRLIVNN